MVTSPQYDPEYVPVRGDVVWIDFDSQAGNETMKRRLALLFNEHRYAKTV